MKKELEEKGYVIVKGFFLPKEIDELLYTMINIAQAIHRRETGGYLPGTGSLTMLDDIVKTLFKKDKDLVGELYDAFSQTAMFLRFICGEELEKMIRWFLGDSRNPLYCFTNRCRIDPPHDTRRTYGWHQEIFYTIPKGRFLQTWAPLFRDTTIQNGTIEIAEGSHRKGIAPQVWSEEVGKATQIIVNAGVIKKYNCKPIEMKVGDLLIFTGHTAHRSGYNSSDQIRYSLVGMYHDACNHEVYWPRPNFEHRGINQKEYFNEQMKRK